jgi:16S rRNA (uracil1498-N3)-methyltransferase
MYVKYFTPEKGITLSAQQSHYLRHVMRVKNNDRIRVFNAEMGEFIAEVQIFQIIPIECVRHPEPLPPLTLLAFSLLRPHLTHLVVEKATELGVSHLQPVVFEFTQIKHVAISKLQLVANEAAEQCNRMDTPEICEPLAFQAFIASKPYVRWFTAMERCESAPLLSSVETAAGVIIGPEGGFSATERAILESSTEIVSLGRNTLRSETAAICALCRLRG